MLTITASDLQQGEITWKPALEVQEKILLLDGETQELFISTLVEPLLAQYSMTISAVVMSGDYAPDAALGLMKTLSDFCLQAADAIGSLNSN